MLKRLLLVFIIGVGIIPLPYYAGLITYNYIDHKPLLTAHSAVPILFWVMGGLVLLLAGIIIGVVLAPLAVKVIDYIKYGSFILLLLVGMGVKGQAHNPFKEKNVIVAYYYDSAMSCITHVDTIYLNRPDLFPVPFSTKIDSVRRKKNGLNYYNGAAMPTHIPIELSGSKENTIDTFKLKQIYFKQ